MIEKLSPDSRKITELEHIGVPADSDYLVVERKNFDGSKQSFKITYGNFKKQIIRAIRTNVINGTMMYKDKNEYSKFAHGHVYSDFNFFPSYGPDSNNPEYKDENKCIKLGTFKIVKYFPGENVKKTIVKRVYIKKVRESEPVDKTVGFANHWQYEAKLMSTGWSGNCIQDGTGVTWWPVDSVEASGTTFVKLGSANEQVTAMPYQNGLAWHSHELITDYSTGGQEIELKNLHFTQRSTGTNSNRVSDNTLHGGSGSDKNKVTINVKSVKMAGAQIVSGAVSQSLGADGESYPAYNVIGLVYYR